MPKKILLIDDDADDRALFLEALANVAPEVTCYWAANGRKALAALDSKEIKTPDLIFLDVNMPVMSGWQCIASLKEEDAYKNIPVIMYSTASHQDEVQRAIQAGALCFFSKPPDFQTLQKYLAAVVLHLNNDSLASLAVGSSLPAPSSNCHF